jgi:hypothetical protein
MAATHPTISVIDLTSQLGAYALGQLGGKNPSSHGFWPQIDLAAGALAPKIDWYRPYSAKELVPPAAESVAVVLVVGPGSLDLLRTTLQRLAEVASVPAAIWIYLTPSALMESYFLNASIPKELGHALVYRLPDSSPQSFWFVFMEQLGKLSSSIASIQSAENPTKEHSFMASNLTKSLAEIMTVNGALAAALVDYRSGMCLAQVGSGLNLDLAAAGNTEVVRAKLKTIDMLGLRRGIEDILITLVDQYHLIRLVPNSQGLFLYLVLDKEKGNLALARFKLSEIERLLVV